MKSQHLEPYRSSGCFCRKLPRPRDTAFLLDGIQSQITLWLLNSGDNAHPMNLRTLPSSSLIGVMVRRFQNADPFFL
jgi:hypothetical protein